MENPTLGFVLIISRPPIALTILQFFRYYGYPIRTSFADRANETISIIIVYVFVLNFPIGLFALLWMNKISQYLWLGQQLYCVVAMYIVRLLGWQSCLRTEERAAKLLLKDQQAVYYVGTEGCVKVRLEIEEVTSVGAARLRVSEIL